MKKLLSMVLAGMMVLSLAACSGNEVQESSQPEASSTTEQVSESGAPASQLEESESASVSSSEVTESEGTGTNMLVAYYCKNVDSRDIFSGFKIANDETFEKHLNKYNVIQVTLSCMLSLSFPLKET